MQGIDKDLPLFLVGVECVVVQPEHARVEELVESVEFVLRIGGEIEGELHEWFVADCGVGKSTATGRKW